MKEASENKKANEKEVKPEKKQPVITEGKLIATIKELGGKATLQQVRLKLGIPVKSGKVWNTEAMRVVASKAVEARTLKKVKEGSMLYYQAV